MRRSLAVCLLLLALAAALLGVWGGSRDAPEPAALARRSAWVRLTGLADPALGTGFPALRHRALADPASLWAAEPGLREAYPAWPLGAPPEVWRGAADLRAQGPRP